jgi:hypothetical protein
MTKRENGQVATLCATFWERIKEWIGYLISHLPSYERRNQR